MQGINRKNTEEKITTLITMKDVGLLIRTPNNTFEYKGEIYGKVVVLYQENIKGIEKLIVKEVGQEDIKQVEDSIKRMSNIKKEKASIKKSNSEDLFS